MNPTNITKLTPENHRDELRAGRVICQQRADDGVFINGVIEEIDGDEMEFRKLDGETNTVSIPEYRDAVLETTDDVCITDPEALAGWDISVEGGVLYAKKYGRDDRGRFGQVDEAHLHVSSAIDRTVYTEASEDELPNGLPDAVADHGWTIEYETDAIDAGVDERPL